MTDTEHLIHQAAREIQISVNVAIEGTTNTVTLTDRHGNNASLEVQDGDTYKDICDRMRVAYRANNQT